MKIITIPSFLLFLMGCQTSNEKTQLQIEQPSIRKDSQDTISYDELKQDIEKRRKLFSIKYEQLNTTFKKEFLEEINNYWVNSISNDLYNEWENTPWDFNGTTSEPQKGNIACGFFVATILQDMDLKVNRRKLSVCTSSQMMKSLTPQQKPRNLSYLSYPEFNNKLKEYGKGVYITGLDYHTGFIVNDGTEIWFIHANYIGSKGVTKEKVMHSSALKSSKTRWVVSLTGDKDFLQGWLNGI